MVSHEWMLTIESLLRAKQHPIAGLANVAAVLWEAVADINWAGFYFMDQGALHLGPFHGKVACTEIRLGHGVCGAALEKDQTLIVPDVHAFPGHIACDEASRSEIVVPLHWQGKPVGVLDVDSPIADRFTKADQEFLESVARLIEGTLALRRMGYDLGGLA